MMQRFNLLQLWRRAGGSKTALAVTLSITVIVGMLGVGTLLVTRAANQGTAHTKANKPGHASKKDEGTWFQLSHFGKSRPPADARAKALKQAQKLPKSPLLGATRTAASAPNLPSAGGGWVPLGPVGENSSTCAPNNCNNYGVNSGRITAEAVNPVNGNDIWVGAADGGLWHSTDGGATWASVSDNSTVNGGPWPTLSIGSIAIDPGNANTIYVGSGEANLNGDAYWGVGVFKSSDGGATWTLYGASQFGGLGIGKMAVDPHNSSIVLAAVAFDGFSAPSGSGIPWGNLGIWKSTNGGQTWTLVLHNVNASINSFDAGTDIAFDPAHSGEVFVGLANSFARPTVSFSSGAGVWFSANSGSTWSKLSNGIPTEIGRASCRERV